MDRRTCSQSRPRQAGQDLTKLTKLTKLTGSPGGPHVVTDGLRRKEVDFGSASANTSQLLTAEDPGRSGRAVIDYDSDPRAPRTTLSWRGVRSVTASSSASDATATLRLGPSTGPAAAFDSDLRTRWVGGNFGSAVGEWLRVDLEEPKDLAGATISVSGNTPVSAAPTLLRVDTATGSRTSEVRAGPILPLLVPPGPTTWLRVTLIRVAAGSPNGFAINEIGLPGVTAVPVAAVPTGGGTPDAVFLEEGARGRGECLLLDEVNRCSPTLGSSWEELGWARSWSADSGRTYAATGTVRPLDGPATEQLLALPSGVVATASSRLVSAPGGRPDAALDGDGSTGWVAGEVDPAPWFAVRLPTPR